MCRCSIAFALALGLATPAAAIDVVIDYTYDATNFFGAGNPDGQGAAARAAIEAAADYISDRLTDTFSEVVTPPDYSSQVFGGVFSWQWSRQFFNPATGSSTSIAGGTVPEDEYRVFVGGRALGGNTAGVGGPGGFSWGAGGNGSGFTSAEVAEINQITDAFEAQVEQREEPTGEFATWGGAVTFDSDGSTNWYYDHTSTTVPGNELDFFSVALHELTHAVGFSSNEWDALVVGTQFRGVESLSANGGTFPSISPDGGHWAEGIQNTVFGGTTAQEVLMDPQIFRGTRLSWTDLDAAALRDIGWETLEIPIVEGLVGDYNDDGVVDAADYTIWRDSFENPNVPVIGSYAGWSGNYGATASTATSVPEPAAAALLGLGLLAFRKRR